MASVKVNLSSPIPFAKPDEIYRGNHLARLRLQVQLRIASGPEQSELIKALSNEFIRYKDRNDAEPFSIAWISSNTTASFNHLASRSADLIITHHVVAENIAIKQGVADRSVYAWRDHWLLVGPKSNPANLSTEKTTSIYDHFAQIFLAAVETAGSTHSVKFLSRYDKSAANTKESSCWAAIGQTPWAHPHSSWYHQYTDSALAAIKVAASLGQYTLTDLGTWYTLSDEVREGMSVFAGGDSADDLLLKPAHALVGKHAENKQIADDFIHWLVSWGGGQRVIEQFEINEVRIYKKAPAAQNTTPLTPPYSPLQVGREYL